ncbi:hypothetical protein [Saccharopolyspora sp. NPDC002376]
MTNVDRTRQPKIRAWAAAAITAAAVVLLGYSALQMYSSVAELRGQLAEVDAEAGANAEAAQALAAQVRELGQVPRVEPPAAGQRGERGLQGLTGQRGEQGIPGIPGQPGRDGQQGVPGQSGRDGEPGAAGAQGEQGLPGQNGKDGKDGQDGADGKDGVDGKDGAPPATWSWTDPKSGTTYSCSRSGGSDDAPAYSCTPASSDGESGLLTNTKPR